MKRTAIAFGTIFFTIAFVPFALAAERPCESADFRNFDFWVGEWDVRTPDGKLAGSSSVQLILDKCILFENWTGTSGYSGKSFNIFNKQLGKWQQFWVDNTGGVIEFVGEFKDGVMRLESKSPDEHGKEILGRMTFSQPSPNQVRQVWEQSEDGGKVWKVVFDGLYTRKTKEPAR